MRLGPKNGFKGKSGKYFLEFCPDCERENRIADVASGLCHWCGFNANILKSSPLNRKSPVKGDPGGRTKLHFIDQNKFNKTYCTTLPSFYSKLIRLTDDWKKVTCKSCLILKGRRENGLRSKQVSGETDERIS